MNYTLDDFAGNIERFSGYAGLYDQYRPTPPDILGPILLSLAQVTVPERVVDLGCGTGLSTRHWANKAKEVIGVEPAADMREQAATQTQAENVFYREGFSHRTGLPTQCASIVTCSQALHWMEPQATFEEVRRLLLPDGVFAAYDYDWPPTVGFWEAEAAYLACLEKVWQYESTRPSKPVLRRWSKAEHLTRMQVSGCFRYTKEIVVHHVDQGSANRLVGLLLSQGSVMTLLKQGVSEAELEIDRFRAIAQQVMGMEESTWYWSSRLRFGIV